MKFFKKLSFVALLSVLATGCAQAAETAVPPTTHPLPTAAEISPVSPGDESWTRVQSAGKLVVGTSLDYPPFSTYDADFRPTGFDIALMSKIAEKMKVQVEFKDMAFEGLPGALNVGQVDAAIGAISITPDREQVLDFSHPYMVSADAVLARSDAGFQPVRTVDDLASYRIGVEKGSVYEKWIFNSLVQTNKMSADHFMRYTLLDQALKDLREGRLDVVLLDLLPAQKAAAEGDLKIIGQEMDRQAYGIAVKFASAGLQNALNDALSQLQNDGTVAALAKQYLHTDPGKPLPMPTPGVTPAVIPTPVPSACVDGMAYVADLNLQDNNMANPPQVAANAPLAKGWRIRNTGTCTWTTGYVLAYMGSWPTNGYMTGRPVNIQANVAPGSTYDVYAGMIAPPYPGTYMSFWTLRNPANVPFGDRIYAGIIVPGYPTPPPGPTASPVQGLSFASDKSSISPGERVTFNWSAPGARQVYYGLAGALRLVSNPGSDIESPLSPSNYEVRALFPDGSQKVRQIQIDVMIDPGGPVITRFDVSPSDHIILGDCINLSWSIVNNVNRVTLSRNGTVLSDGAPAESSYKDCPSPSGNYTYVLKARNDRGSGYAQQFVNVSEGMPTVLPPTDEPFPTFVPEPTEEPFPTFVPEPTEEPFPTYVPEPTEEPFPTYVPEPTEEPAPPGPIDGPVNKPDDSPSQPDQPPAPSDDTSDS